MIRQPESLPVLKTDQSVYSNVSGYTLASGYLLDAVRILNFWEYSDKVEDTGVRIQVLFDPVFIPSDTALFHF